jgi:hypothetical protein
MRTLSGAVLHNRCAEDWARVKVKPGEIKGADGELRAVLEP